MFNPYGAYNYGYDSIQSTLILMIVAVVLAIVCTVLSFIFITPEKKRGTLPKFFQIVHDVFNFKGLMIEAILKALYIFFTLFAILYNFFLLFVQTWTGLFGLILAPIFIRLIFEFLMMAILLVKNVISINNKLQKESESKKEDPFLKTPAFIARDQAPKAAPAPTPATEPALCPACGAPLTPGAAFCTSCGAAVKK